MASKIKVDTLETANGSGSITLNNPISGFTSTGSVGIGTSSPAEMLEIYNTSSPAIQLNDGGDYKSIMRLAGNDLEIRGSSGSLEFYNGAADGDSSALAMTIDNSGIVTKPLQPAFMARGVATLNLPVATTTLAFSEVFDQGSDFASNTFTAPVTGKYQLQFGLRVGDISTGANWVRATLATSNRDFNTMIIDPARLFSSNPDYFSISMSVLADMDAGDTAVVEWQQNAGSATTNLDTDSQFSGYLVA